MNSQGLKTCLAGAGYVGTLHASAYRNVASARLAAVSDPDLGRAAALAAPHGAAAYEDYREMIAAERPDIVDVCLPTGMHREAAVAALEAGCHVIVEKPFALTLEDIDAMTGAAQRAGRRIMVAHVCRFMPQYLIARRLVAEGRFGQPIFFGCWRESETPAWSWDSWILDRTRSGGTLMDLSIHDLDVSNWLLGRPIDFSLTESLRPGLPGPSHVVSNLAYEGGARGLIEAGQLMPRGYPFRTGYRLVLEHAVAEWSDRGAAFEAVSLFTDGREQALALADVPAATPRGADGRTDAYAEELEHFAVRIRTGEPFTISCAEARLAVETVLRLTAAGQPHL